MANKKEAAFTTTVSVPRPILDKAYDVISDLLMDHDFDLTKDGFMANKAVQDWLKEEIIIELARYAADLDMCSLISEHNVTRFFKEELKAAAAEQKRKEKEEAAAEEARLAKEREELKKTGRLLNIPAADAAKAHAILQAAGIKVKIL